MQNRRLDGVGVDGRRRVYDGEANRDRIGRYLFSDPRLQAAGDQEGHGRNGNIARVADLARHDLYRAAGALEACRGEQSRRAGKSNTIWIGRTGAADSRRSRSSGAGESRDRDRCGPGGQRLQDDAPFAGGWIRCDRARIDDEAAGETRLRLEHETNRRHRRRQLRTEPHIRRKLSLTGDERRRHRVGRPFLPESPDFETGIFAHQRRSADRNPQRGGWQRTTPWRSRASPRRDEAHLVWSFSPRASPWRSEGKNGARLEEAPGVASGLG